MRDHRSQIRDGKLKRQVCSCLSQVAKHSIDLAEVVVEAEVCPKIFVCLKDKDHVVRRNAATCIREIARHTPELAHLIVNAGGHKNIVDYISHTRGAARLPGHTYTPAYEKKNNLRMERHNRQTSMDRKCKQFICFLAMFTCTRRC